MPDVLSAVTRQTAAEIGAGWLCLTRQLETAGSSMGIR